MPDDSSRNAAATGHVRLEPASHSSFGWWHVEVRCSSEEHRATLCGLQMPKPFTERTDAKPEGRTCPQCRKRQDKQAVLDAQPKTKPGEGPKDPPEQQETLF